MKPTQPFDAEEYCRSFALKLAEETEEAFADEFHDAGLLVPDTSPIEQRLGAALMYVIKSKTQFGMYGHGENHVTDPGPHTFEDYDFSEPKHFAGINIDTQLPIGRYRADFFVTFGHPRGLCYGVIECDGHDYHERTKEQAKRDKERDRYFQSLGMIVLRYTGSEIFQDPLACAIDAISTFEKRALGRRK